VRLLLDAHAFLWFLDGDASLSARARTAIETAGPEVFVSAATAWEITTKFRLGKLEGARDVEAAALRHGFAPLAVTMAHAKAAGALDGAHRDPFDRMPAAQAEAEDLALVSADAALDAPTDRRIW
jgi:PIN domain nuclease of toxin-antitoxin system